MDIGEWLQLESRCSVCAQAQGLQVSPSNMAVECSALLFSQKVSDAVTHVSQDTEVRSYPNPNLQMHAVS